MDTAAHTHVLLETMAQAAHPYPQSDQARHQDIYSCMPWVELEGAIPAGKNACHAIGNNQQVAGATGARLRKGTVDQVSLRLMNRLVRTRMLGGVGPPALITASSTFFGRVTGMKYSSGYR